MAAVGFLLALGLALGLIIGIAAKLFAVETDPRIEQVEDLLPGANCGACGFAGCADFARAVVTNSAAPEACPSNTDENVARIAALLGVEVGTRIAKVALVRCGGDDAKATWQGRYNGVADCRSANPVSGAGKGCKYGCLGLGTCANACPFGAIEITNDGLAVVHEDICTGCGKCISVCPRNLIVLVPKGAPVHVYCNSPEKGAVCTKVCKVSCIGCRKCVKASEDGQMTIDGFIARVNYENPPSGEVADVCPTKCLRRNPEAEEIEQRQPAETEKETVHA